MTKLLVVSLLTETHLRQINIIDRYDRQMYILCICNNCFTIQVTLGIDFVAFAVFITVHLVTLRLV